MVSKASILEYLLHNLRSHPQLFADLRNELASTLMNGMFAREKKLKDLKATFLKTTLLLASVFLLSLSVQGSYERENALSTKKDASVFFSNLSYSMSSDAFDQNDQRVFNQGLNYQGTYYFLDKLYAAFGLGASFQSVDTQLVENDNGTFNLTDLNLTLGTKGISLNKSKKNRISLYPSLTNVFPVSERSRNEGYKSVTSGRADLAFNRGKVGLVASLQHSHVFNSFDDNIAGAPNLENSLMGGLSAQLNFKYFRFIYSYRSGLLRFLDGSTLGSSGNAFAVSASYKYLWASLSTSNVNYVEDQFVDLWFYNPFVRIYSLNMGVSF